MSYIYGKKYILIALSLIILITSYFNVSVNGYTQTEAKEEYNKTDVKSIKAKSFSLLDFDSGTVVYEENGDENFPVGNIVKLMTLYLTYVAVKEGKTTLETEFLVVKHAQELSVGKARVFLDAGKKEKITVNQAIEAVCIASANDAAYALGAYIGGSEEKFVKMMNDTANKIGLKNTKYLDSAGLINEGQYSSANDIAILSHRLVNEFPDILNFTKLNYGEFNHKSTGQGKSMMVSSNHLLKFYTGCDGLITGFSNEDGYVGVGTISIEDKRVIAVVIGEENDNIRAAELKKLMEYGLNEFEYRTIDEMGTYVRQVSIKDGVKRKIKTATASDFSIVLSKPEFDKIKREVIVYNTLKAPIKKGEVVGEVIYKIDDKELGKVEIVADEDMGRVGWFKRFIRKILNWLGLE